MKTSTALVVAAASLATTPVAAQETRTVTVDAPRYDATQTSTYNRDTHTVTRETDLTRSSDGATASSNFERQRTEEGITRDRASSDFAGRESSTSCERRRTADGWESEGQHVRRDGVVADYQGQGTRTDAGYVAHQSRSVDGRPAGTRKVERTHAPRRTGRR